MKRTRVVRMIEPIVGIIVVGLILWWIFLGRHGTAGIPAAASTPTEPLTAGSIHTATEQISPTAEPSKTPTQTSQPSATPTPTIRPGCGHALDTPFGMQPQLIIHRVMEGETLDLIAFLYETSTEAIQSINAYLPSPLWLDWLLVVPLNTNIAANLPLFTVLEVHEQDMTIEELAASISIAPNLLRTYNALPPDCSSFDGWIIVPVETVIPSATP